jgi:hypothetical protein
LRKTIDNAQKVCYNLDRQKERSKNKPEQMLKSGKRLKAADGLKRFQDFYLKCPSGFGGMQIPQSGACVLTMRSWYRIGFNMT